MPDARLDFMLDTNNEKTTKVYIDNEKPIKIFLADDSGS